MLSPRLEAVAKMCEGGHRLLDVGTDHGYIPVHFALQGTKQRVAASDVKQGPLDAARRNAAENGAEDLIEFYLSDGLSGIDEDFDTIVISGMGGETIMGILERSGRDFSGVSLILQPQSKLELLESWLSGSGFSITDARIVLDDGRYYVVFKAEKSVNGAARVLDMLFEKKDLLLEKYIDSLLERYRVALRGLESAKAADPRQSIILQSAVSRLVQIKEMILNDKG